MRDMTRTYALLVVPDEVWNAIKDALLKAGRRESEVDRNGEIDMHGIALVKER